MVSNSSEADDVVADAPVSNVSGEAQSLWLGALLLTGGFLANTVQGALGKVAQETVSPGQFLWLLFVVALGVLLPVALWRRPDAFQVGWDAQVMPFYLLRAVFGLCGFYLFVWAAGLGSLVDATVLLNTTPVFIPVIGVIGLAQQISLKLWCAITLGFVGLLLVVQPSAELLREPANLLGLGAGFSAAIEFLTVRWLGKTQPSLTQTLYYLLIGLVLMAPIALWEWQPLALITVKIVVAAAGAFLIFQLLLVRAYSYAEPHQIGAFQYTSVVFAAAIGWFFFSEVPNAIALLGMLLICVGGAFSVYFERSPEPLASSGAVQSDEAAG